MIIIKSMFYTNSAAHFHGCFLSRGSNLEVSPLDSRKGNQESAWPVLAI